MNNRRYSVHSLKSVSLDATRVIARPNSPLLAGGHAERIVNRALLRMVTATPLALLGVSSIGAQPVGSSRTDACSEMLALFQVDFGGGEASDNQAAQCDNAINVQVLLMASTILNAREQAPAVCVPANSEATLSRVAEIFYGYAIQYLDTLYENPFLLLIEALEEDFPCEPFLVQTPSSD